MNRRRSEPTAQPVTTPGAASRALFSCVGLEVELMIVDRETLDVRPLAEDVLASVTGEVVSEVEVGELAWSNELVAHVVELKTNGPASKIDSRLMDAFVRHVRRIDELLTGYGARLLPTAMHPWMDPLRETVLWPHEHSEVYHAYDRIFGCRGHGWSNLQSLHLNLPFADDAEFGRLHAAIRLLLPLLPALAASSPLVDGAVTGKLDNRMALYGTNSRRIPSVTGTVIPEPVFDRAGYQRRILEPMYRDIAPFDPDGVLQHEFLNSRGAIARFDRGAIEIRVIDSQECPLGDLAIAAGVIAVLRLLVDDSGDIAGRREDVEQQALVGILAATVRDGERARVTDAAYLERMGVGGDRRSAGEVWASLLERVLTQGLLEPRPWGETLQRMIELGPLARRMLHHLDGEPSRSEIRELYRRLADCLVANELFEPGAGCGP